MPAASPCGGSGPIGTYAAEREHGPSIRLSAQLDTAVADADLIWLTGPVPKQRTCAMVLAEHLSDGQVLALVPGRSFGALEIVRYLRAGGCRADVVVAEVQALPYWIHAERSTLHLTRAAATPAAALPDDREDVIRGLARFLPNLAPVQGVVRGSFADGSGLVEIPALLLGGPAVPPGGPKLPAGAVPLPERNTFRALIGERHRAFVEAMATERRRVAARWGVRDLPDADAWLDAHAGAPAGDMARPVPSAGDAQRLIRLRGRRIARTPALGRRDRRGGRTGHPGDGDPRGKRHSATTWRSRGGASIGSASARAIRTTPGGPWTAAARGGW